MANSKQAIKRARQNSDRYKLRHAQRSVVRTAVKAVRADVDSKDKAKASESLIKAQKVIDKAASKNVIHKNAAARTKSRLSKAIKELKAGKLDARVEKNGILQSTIGKTSFSEDQLKENFNSLQTAVMSAKPNSFKGKYVKSVSISSTLGPGIKIGIE